MTTQSQPNQAHRLYIDQRFLHSLVLPHGITMFDFTIVKQTTDMAVVIIADRTYPVTKYVLRLYRVDVHPMPLLEKTVQFIDYLYRQRLPVPHIHENQEGATIVSLTADKAEWAAFLTDFAEGAVATRYTPLVIERMAAVQAIMHNLGDRFGLAQANAAIGEPVTYSGFISPNTVPQSVSDARLPAMLQRGRMYTTTYDTTVTRGYGYDYFDGDVVIFDSAYVIKGVITVDGLQFAPVVTFLAYTLWHVLYMTSDWQLTARYLATYQAERLLSEKERSYIVPSMLLWHYRSLERYIQTSGAPITEVARYAGIEQILLTTTQL